jgi:DNA-binding transcriptional ArsR family regulator
MDKAKIDELMGSTSLPVAALSNKKRFAFADSTQKSTTFSNWFSISLRASGASRFNSSHLEGSCSPAAPFTISLAAASKHIKVLENAGLIRREVRGRTHWCRFDRGPLANAHQWLSLYERFWTGRLDVLERLLRKEDAHKSTTPKTGEDQ